MVWLSWEEQAYSKLLLHVAKYSADSVCGLLLGRQVYLQPTEASSVNETWVIKDCIPLLHGQLNLTPLLDMGIELSRTVAEQQGLFVLGMYLAKERFDDGEPTLSTFKWAERVHQDRHNSIQLFVMVDNIKLAPDIRVEKVPLRIFYKTKQTTRWLEFAKDEPEQKLSVIPLKTLEFAESCISNDNLFRDFHDFDDHCMEPRFQWLEPLSKSDK